MMPTRAKKKARKKTARRVKPKTKRHASATARRTGRKATPRARPRPAKTAPASASRAASPRAAVKRARRRPSSPRSAASVARPILRVVRTPRASRAAAPAPQASFPQRGGASPKQLILFELIRARAAVLSAIQGLSPASANVPMGDGRWSVRETVLHLVTRDQARLRESESTRHGQSASWKGIEDPAMGVLNAELMAPLRHLDWEDAVRTLHRVREQLIEEIESVPEEPSEVWSPDHPFGWMLHALPPHDRHHADSIKRWRLERTL